MYKEEEIGCSRVGGWVGGRVTIQEGTYLGKARRTPKWNQAHLPSPQVGKYGRSPLTVGQGVEAGVR